MRALRNKDDTPGSEPRERSHRHTRAGVALCQCWRGGGGGGGSAREEDTQRWDDSGASGPPDGHEHRSTDGECQRLVDTWQAATKIDCQRQRRTRREPKLSSCLLPLVPLGPIRLKAGSRHFD